MQEISCGIRPTPRSRSRWKDLDFEQLAFTNKIEREKCRYCSLDFVPGGTSFVDVALTGDNIDLTRWLFLPFASLSDHPFVYLELAVKQNCPGIPRPKGAIPFPKYSDIDQKSFLELFKYDLLLSPQLPLMNSTASVDNQINSVHHQVRQSGEGEKTEARPAKNMPWWTKDLCSLRKNARRAYSAWSKEKNEENRSLYRRAKSIYQRELRCESWLDQLRPLLQRSVSGSSRLLLHLWNANHLLDLMAFRPRFLFFAFL